MHKEIAKREGNPVLLIIGIVVLIFTFMSILDTIAMGRYSIVIDGVAICFLTALAYYIMKHKIVDYKYVLIDTDLIFKKVFGQNESDILDVNVAEILMIAPCGNQKLKEYQKVEKNYKMTTSFFGKNKYCGVFTRQGKVYKFTFEPSEKLLNLLKRSIAEKVFEA